MMKERLETVRRFGVIRCSWLLGFSLLMLGGCEDKKEFLPHSSPEYLAQFGVVNGQTNFIEVSGVKFRIPPQYPIDVVSHPPIRKGHADLIYFTLDFSNAIDGKGPVVPGADPQVALTEPQRHGGSIRAGVKVEISHYNGESYSMVSRWPQDKITEQWGLRGYAGRYESIVERTPNGNPVQFFCVNTYACFGRFEYPKGIVITYDIDRSMLPHWKVIYTGTLQVVDSLVFEKK
jgi:hypothetical protein